MISFIGGIIRIFADLVFFFGKVVGRPNMFDIDLAENSKCLFLALQTLNNVAKLAKNKDPNDPNLEGPFFWYPPHLEEFLGLTRTRPKMFDIDLVESSKCLFLAFQTLNNVAKLAKNKDPK